MRIYFLTLGLILALTSSCKKNNQPIKLQNGDIIGKWYIAETMISPGNEVPWTKVPFNIDSNYVNFTANNFNGPVFHSGVYKIIDSIRMELNTPNLGKSIYYYRLKKDTLIMNYSGCTEACALKFFKVHYYEL